MLQLKDTTYLLITDYFSRYPEVCRLTSTTSPAIIKTIKAIFITGMAFLPLCEVTMGHNSTHLSFNTLRIEECNFTHTSSSPYYSQSNGFVERGVKTVKRLLQKSEDPYVELQSCTPALVWMYSPTELLMGKKVRTTLPQTTHQLIPDWQFLDEFREREEKYKKQQKRNYDKRHRV